MGLIRYTRLGMLSDLVVSAIISVTDFPLAPECIEDTSKYCDYMILRYDINTRDKSFFNEATKRAREHCDYVFDYSEGGDYDQYNWRESMLRRLDIFRPDLVITLDQDEMFGPGLEDEIERFKHTDASQMIFDYEMVTKDSKEVPKYPHDPHTKLLKWMKGTSYIPYRGSCTVNTPKMNYKTFSPVKIKHYCFWDSEARETKRLQGDVIWQGKRREGEGKLLKKVVPEIF